MPYNFHTIPTPDDENYHPGSHHSSQRDLANPDAPKPIGMWENLLVPTDGADTLAANQGFVQPPSVARLTEKLRKFAQYVAIYGDNDRGTTKAARLSGYAPGNNYRTLEKPGVREAIEYYSEVFATVAHYTPEKVVMELAALADVDITDAFDDTWQFRPKSEWPPALRRALIGIDIKPSKYGLQVRPQFAKLEALTALARLFGMHRSPEEQPTQGTSLTINVGQSTTIDGEKKGNTLEVGGLTIQTSR